MKKAILLFIVLISVLNGYSQTTFTKDNTEDMIALWIYLKNETTGYNDLYKDYDIPGKVGHLKEVYAYDNSERAIFVTNIIGNYKIILNKSNFNYYKKRFDIPKYNQKELAELIQSKNDALDKLFGAENERIKAEKEKVINMREDSLKQAALEMKTKTELYKKNTKWSHMPTGGHGIYCDLCNHVINHQDTLIVLGISNDSIYYRTSTGGFLGERYAEWHFSKIPSGLRNDDAFMRHAQVFRDSLVDNRQIVREDLIKQNERAYNKYKERLRTVAPDGFIYKYDWKNDISLAFSVNFFNSSKKTMKYIDFQFKVLNDVKDVRLTGHLTATGPLEPEKVGTWNWDNTDYYLAGDATIFEFTKIVVTYMDGTKGTIPGKYIFIQDDF